MKRTNNFCRGNASCLPRIDEGYPRAAFLCGGHPRIKKRQDRGTPTENHTQIHQRLAIDRLAAIVAIAITKKETFYA